MMDISWSVWLCVRDGCILSIFFFFIFMYGEYLSVKNKASLVRLHPFLLCLKEQQCSDATTLKLIRSNAYRGVCYITDS